MTQNEPAAKKQNAKKKKKPLHRASRWGRQVPSMALKLVSITVATVVLGLMFSALQSIGSYWLRAAISLLIAAGLLLIHFSEGLAKGLADAQASRAYERALRVGQTPAEGDSGCYQPLKAVCAALCVYGLPLLLAAFISATAQEYTYTLQDLPAWLTSGYSTRSDVMAPLAAYAQQAGVNVYEILRMIVRLMELIFVNLFEDPLTMSAAIDRFSPLMIATYPIAYVLGYLRGPAHSAKEAAMNRKAKKVAVRKAQKSHLAEELVGGGGDVHYGHKAQEDQKKRKELI